MDRLPSDRAIWLGRQILPHEARLRAWLGPKLSAGLELDDVVQESFSVLARMESVAHIRNPRTYLFEVAKSIVVKSLRQSLVVPLSAVVEIENLQLPCEAPDPERIVGARRELEHMAALIAALPPKCREAFILRKVKGMPLRDIAKKMRISESTVEKHIGKALKALAAAMTDGGTAAMTASIEREREQHLWRERGHGG